MAIYNELNSIMHEIGEIDLDNFVYRELFATDTRTVLINGTSVDLLSGSHLQVVIKSISGAADSVFLLGSPKAIYTFDTNL